MDNHLAARGTSRSAIYRRKRRADVGYLLAHRRFNAADWMKPQGDKRLRPEDTTNALLSSFSRQESDITATSDDYLNTMSDDAEMTRKIPNEGNDCSMEGIGEKQMTNHFLQNTSDSLNTSLTLKNQITDNDYLLGILAIAMKYNQTYEEILAYTKFTDSTFVCSRLPTTKHMLWKVLKRNDEAYQKHYFCKYCRSKVGEGNVVTKSCPCTKTGPQSAIKDVPYFLAIDLRMQVADILSIPNISSALRYRDTRKKYENSISDIYDGIEYKKLRAPGKFLHDEWNLSYMFNTDGASCFNSATTSVWPIYITINELPPHMRKRHMLLGGVWAHKQKPIANEFFLPFVKKANEKLYTEGISWKPYGNSTVVSKKIPLIFSADSPARCQFLRMKRYNGKYGCTFCLIPGTFPKKASKSQLNKPPTITKSTQAKYPYIKEYTRRTHNMIKIDGKNAFSGKSDTHGVHGLPALAVLKGFNLAKGPVPDALHFFWSGCIKQYISMCIKEVGRIKKVQKSHPWYIGGADTMKSINEVLLSIKLPSRISRQPQDLKNYKQYKGTEWRNLAYYFLVCLEDKFPVRDLKNLALLFEIAYICNQDKITYDELNRIEKLVPKFLKYFQFRFGHDKMTYNMHLLTHVVEAVRNWGPMWVYNSTIFESMNNKILKSIKSPIGVVEQVATRFLMNKFIQNCAYDPSIHLETRNHISKLLNVKIHYENIVEDSAEGYIQFKKLGDENQQSATTKERQILRDAGFSCEELTYYDRALIHGVEYRTSKFRNNTTFANYTVFCEGIGFGDIEKIITFRECEKMVYGVIICKMTTKGNALNTTFIKDVSLTNDKIFVEANKIAGPAFKITKREKIRAIKIPNCWETD